jgi:hypothetical protein
MIVIQPEFFPGQKVYGNTVNRKSDIGMFQYASSKGFKHSFAGCIGGMNDTSVAVPALFSEVVLVNRGSWSS